MASWRAGVRRVANYEAKDSRIFDATIINAGVIGAATARELSKYKLRIAIVEYSAGRRNVGREFRR
jgi:glycine/D-amino acid oxidase-like deaminating enzyme